MLIKKKNLFFDQQHLKQAAISLSIMDRWASTAQVPPGQEMLSVWSEGAIFASAAHPKSPCQGELTTARGRTSKTLVRTDTGLDR